MVKGFLSAASRFFLTIRPSRDAILAIERQKLLILYAVVVASLSGALYNIRSDIALEDWLSVAMLAGYLFFILASVVLFWIKRRLNAIVLTFTLAIILLMVEIARDAGGSTGYDIIYIITAYPVLYALLGFNAGVLLSVLFWSAVLIRLFLGNFPSGSLFYDPATIPRMATAISVATDLGLCVNIVIDRLISHLSRSVITERITRLASRWKTEDYLIQRLQAFEREEGSLSLVAIHFLNFNRINAMLGTAAGDIVLREIGRRLQLPRENMLMAGRWNSAIFILIVDTSDFLALDSLCRSVLSSLGEPFPVSPDTAGTVVSGQFTLAITRYPDDAVTADQLISNSVSILDRNAHLPGELIFFSPENLEKERYRFKIAEALAATDFETGFRLLYQPKVSLSTNMCTGAELLVRWHHEDFGEISPSVFIPIAEESGVIKKLTRWVIQRAMRDLSSPEYRVLCEKTPLVNAINLSVTDLKDQDLLPFILREMQDLPCLSQKIEFEITEGVLVDDNPWIKLNLENFMNLGFRIAIDDFGTGYSSLSYLHKLKVHNLKIDQSFIRPIDPSIPDATYPVVEAIISMATSLGLEITAEGVETTAQADWLRERGCDYIQGWLNSKAIPFPEYLEFIKDRLTL